MHYTFRVTIGPPKTRFATDPKWSRRGYVAVAVLAAIVAVELALLAISTGRAPNALTLPLIEQLPLLGTLWSSNPRAALSITAQQAVFVIEHRAADTGLQVWGIYGFPLTLAAYGLIAWLFASFLAQSAPWARWKRLAFSSGAVLLATSVTYVRLASCCTLGPRWSVDIVLLAQALDPTSTLINWQSLYALVEPLFPATQAMMGIGGALLLYVSTVQRRTPGSLPPVPRRHAD